MRRLISSESVTEGHPDKLADRISDSVLDAMLQEDPNARVAVETILTTGLALIAGEVTCDGYVDVQRIVRDTVREVGYTDAAFGIDADHSAVLIALAEQSPDIAQGVDTAFETRAGATDPFDRIGAGDQGLMFGYACRETDTLMPLPITLAHALTQRLAAVRKDGTLSYLRPDGKAQVTVLYEGDEPIKVDTVVISAQHAEEVDTETIRHDLLEHVVRKEVPERLVDTGTRIYVNPTGRFVRGGPQADAGLTGRKIVVDTYGGAVPHGGGAFSGKDATKVDRSANYYARYVAKNLVAAGLADRCQVQFAYAIGVAQPVGAYVESFGTSEFSDERLGEIVRDVFDARPAAIIEQLDLRRPQFAATSAYGHFGRDGFAWERTDRVDAVRRAAGLV